MRLDPKRIWVVLLAIGAAVVTYSLIRNDTSNPEKPKANETQPLPLALRVASTTASAQNSRPNILAATESLSAQNDRKTLLDPQSDAWETEDISQQAASTLKKLKSLLIRSTPIDSASLSAIISSQMELGYLRPQPMEIIFQDASITVRQSGQTDDRQTPVNRGAESFATALSEFIENTMLTTDAQIKFKIVGVDAKSRQSVTTQIHFQYGGGTKTGKFQHSADWTVRWARTMDGQELRISSVKVSNCREALGHIPSGAQFADCTESVFSQATCYQDQLRYGADFWMRRLESNLSPRLLEGHIGFALGDANGDGLEDLYVCQPGGLPNRLLLQRYDGTVHDASQEAGVDFLDWSLSSLFLDLDNDADQDLALLTGTGLLLLANDGNGQFAVKTTFAGRFEYSMAAVDYDNDGNLDLYLCNYAPDRELGLARFSRPIPFFNATNGGQNILLRNNGNWSVTDVTEQVGLHTNNTRWSYAASWEDYDNDGDMDLYVANDFGHNNLYRNDRGTFEDVAKTTGALDANFGMSVSWGDYNRDGWMDAYVGNMFSAAGNRITFQEQFKQGLAENRRNSYQQLARGNTLLQNSRGESFRDTSVVAGVTMGRWSWGSIFADINNDGWEDLLVANGYLTQEPTNDL